LSGLSWLRQVRGRRAHPFQHHRTHPRPPLDPKVLERVVAFGVTLLILLFVLLTFNDIRRIFG